MADTHTVMPKKLAQALMDAGMSHFDGGGLFSGLAGAAGATGGQPGGHQPAGPGSVNVNRAANTNTGGLNGNAAANPVGAIGATGMLGGSNSTANQFVNSPLGQAAVNPLGTLFGGTQNNFQAASAGDTAAQIQQQYGQQQDVYGQQQALAAQLLAQTQGQGPAQQLLAQQGANLGTQQAAQMASARGASANPALMARNAAMAGQQGQQNVLNAQAGMQLQSQNSLAQQQATMAGQALQGQATGQTALAAQNTVNAGVAAGNAAGNKGLLGGIMSGVSSMFNSGGEVKKYADGGITVPQVQAVNVPAPPAAADSGGKSDSGGLGAIMSLAALLSRGGPVPGQMIAGGGVPGKASVKGDSPKNDTVPTLLSPGEVVIPRSIVEAEDAPEKAAEFLRHLKSKKKGGYSKVAEARKAK